MCARIVQVRPFHQTVVYVHSGGGKNQGNGPGENRNTRRTITALSRLVEPKDGDDGRGAHARAHLTHLLSQTSGLATVIRPLVLVSVVSNIGEMHVLKVLKQGLRLAVEVPKTTPV